MSPITISTYPKPFIHICRDCSVWFCRTFSHIWKIHICTYQYRYPHMHLSIYPHLFTRFDQVRILKHQLAVSIYICMYAWHDVALQISNWLIQEKETFYEIVCVAIYQRAYMFPMSVYIHSMNNQSIKITNAGAAVVSTWKAHRHWGEFLLNVHDYGRTWSSTWSCININTPNILWWIKQKCA